MTKKETDIQNFKELVEKVKKILNSNDYLKKSIALTEKYLKDIKHD